MKMDEILTYNLKRLRKERKLTQAEIAELSGLTTVGYQGVEAGRRWPKPDTISAIAKGFCVSEHDLFFRDIETESNNAGYEKLKELSTELKDAGMPGIIDNDYVKLLGKVLPEIPSQLLDLLKRYDFPTLDFAKVLRIGKTLQENLENPANPTHFSLMLDDVKKQDPKFVKDAFKSEQRLDLTDYGNLTAQEIEMVAEMDQVFCRCQSWQKAYEFYEEDQFAVWCRSLFEIKNSAYAMQRFFGFYEKWHPNRSCFPGRVDQGFPDRLPQWIIDSNPYYEEYDFYTQKDFLHGNDALQERLTLENEKRQIAIDERMNRDRKERA